MNPYASPIIVINDELWDMKIEKLGDYVDYITAGGTPSTSVIQYWENGNIPWMSSGEVNKKIITHTDKYITQLGYDNSSTKYIDTNCVLIALAGQGKTRGTVAINEIPICTNQSIAAIKTSEKLNYRYLYQYLTYKYNDIRDYSSGDGGRGGLNLTMLKNYNIQVCDIDSQQKIANFLSSIDDLINLLIEEYELKKLEFEYLSKLLFNNNDTWQSFQLQEIADIYQPTTISQDKFINTGQYRVFGANGYIGRYDKYNHDIETTTISCRGENCGTVNLVDPYTWITGNSMVVSPKVSTLNNKFLFYQLHSQNLKYLVSGSGQPQIIAKDVRIHKINVPDETEQQKIVSLLDLKSEEIIICSNLINQYELMKKHYLNIIFK